MARMYLRHTTRKKDGKVHHYWRLVRSVRVGRRVIQQTVAQLGELDEHGRLEARALARRSNPQSSTRSFASFRAKTYQTFGHLVVAVEPGVSIDSPFRQRGNVLFKNDSLAIEVLSPIPSLTS